MSIESLPTFTKPARQRWESVPADIRQRLLSNVWCGSWPDVHGRPRFAKLSVRDGSKEKIAPVHSDFCCETSSLSLMGSAGWRLDRLHALWVPRPGRAMPTTV
jgi:hypothetical protein